MLRDKERERECVCVLVGVVVGIVGEVGRVFSWGERKREKATVDEVTCETEWKREKQERYENRKMLFDDLII